MPGICKGKHIYIGTMINRCLFINLRLRILTLLLCCKLFLVGSETMEMCNAILQISPKMLFTREHNKKKDCEQVELQNNDPRHKSHPQSFQFD